MRPPIELGDGRQIEIRPIEPGDREALAHGFERLGAESRYLRFFGAIDRLSEAQLTYLTDVDHHSHEALVAVDPATRDGVGVARFVRVREGVAEPAVAVADDWQGHGVGVKLLDALATRAWEEGIRVFAAPVLADNDVAISALSHLGPTQIIDHGAEVELLVELDGAHTTASPLRRLLRHAAQQTLRPGAFSWWGASRSGS